MLRIVKVFPNRELRYLLMTTSSQGHPVEEVFSGGGGLIGFEGYRAGFNGPGTPPMTGGNMGYAAYPPATHVSHHLFHHLAYMYTALHKSLKTLTEKKVTLNFGVGL